jgi:hypothetical protein
LSDWLFIAQPWERFAEAGTDDRVEQGSVDQGCPAVGEELLHYLIAL